MSKTFLAEKLELAFGCGQDFSDVGGELAEAEQFAGGEEFVADGTAAGSIYGADDSLAILVDNGEDVLVGDGFGIEEVGAVAGNDNTGKAAQSSTTILVGENESRGALAGGVLKASLAQRGVNCNFPNTNGPKTVVLGP